MRNMNVAVQIKKKSLVLVSGFFYILDTTGNNPQISQIAQIGKSPRKNLRKSV